MDRIAVSLMIKGPLSLLLLGLGVYLSGNIVWGVTGLVLAWAAILVAWDIRNGALMLNHMPQPRWHLKTLKKLVWLSLPLGFVMMLISLNANIPRYFIKQYLGERELGIFAAIAYLIVAGNMVVRALGESATPRLAKYYASGNSKAFRNLMIKLVAIAALLGCAGVLVAVVAGDRILIVIYGYEYAEQTNLFIWLMIAAGFTYISSFLGYGITAARYFRIQMPLFAAVATTSALACLWLLPKLGLLGAAIALIMSAIIQAGIILGVVIYAINKLESYAVKQE